MHSAIIADKLVKRFKANTVVDHVSFEVRPGEIYGFLGPNGAGKSTTVSMLTTLSLPTEGRATVGGYDVVTQAADVRRVAGVALQEVGLDPLMKSMELLTLQAQLFGANRKQARQRAEELLTLVKLTDVTARPVGKYSGGMRRRLDLAMALVHEPSILFLDEPTTGLDPASRRDVWAEVRRLNRERGMTIFLTTQYLEEADALADRVAIIAHGKIAVEGQPARLKADLGTESINVTFADETIASHAAQALTAYAVRVQQDRAVVRLYLPDAAFAVPTVVRRLEEIGTKPVSLTLTQPTLDDVFLQVTGERYDAAEAAALPAAS